MLAQTHGYTCGLVCYFLDQIFAKIIAAGSNRHSCADSCNNPSRPIENRRRHAHTAWYDFLIVYGVAFLYCMLQLRYQLLIRRYGVFCEPLQLNV